MPVKRPRMLHAVSDGCHGLYTEEKSFEPGMGFRARYGGFVKKIERGKNGVCKHIKPDQNCEKAAPRQCQQEMVEIPPWPCGPTDADRENSALKPMLCSSAPSLHRTRF